jgi:transposase
VAAVEEGMSRHEAAKVFKVGVSSVIRWVQRHHETGSVSPKPMGGDRGSRIVGADREWLLARIAGHPDLTLEELRQGLAEHGLVVGYGTVWRFCDREKLTLKKNSAGHATRSDETWAKDNMTRFYGRCRRGQRLVAKIPLARWETTTFIAALRYDRISAPMVLDGPIDGAWFLAYVEQVLAPTLEPGDIVVLDNLGSHRSEKVRQIVEANGASLLYLPKYSPDLNPIENAFAKLKAGLRGAAERSTEALWNRIGALLTGFTPQECANYFRAAGYAPT